MCKMLSSYKLEIAGRTAFYGLPRVHGYLLQDMAGRRICRMLGSCRLAAHSHWHGPLTSIFILDMLMYLLIVLYFTYFSNLKECYLI